MHSRRRAVLVTSTAAAGTLVIATLTMGSAAADPVGPAIPDGGPARYRPAAGYLDPGFGRNGTVELPGGEAIASGPKGSIWVLGSVVYTDGVSRYLNRLTASGKADSTFTGPVQTSNATDLTTGPIVSKPGGGISFAVNLCCRKKLPPISQVAVHTVSKAGKRLSGIAGTTVWPLADVVPAAPTDADYVIGGVVRLSDGSLRACVSIYPGGDRDPFAALVGVRADGSIDPRVGAGDSTMPALGWTKVAGLIDCGFASAGLQQLFVDGSDRLYVVGNAAGLTSGATRVVRTSAAGVPDPGYGTAGKATIKSATRSYSPLTGLVAADGVLYLGLSSRSTAIGAKSVATVVKLTAAGARDPKFGRNGVSRFFPTKGSSELDSIGFLPGGRLVLGLVYASGNTRSGRLTAIAASDGGRATNFGIGGTVVSGTLTWGTLVRNGYLLTIGNVLPSDPAAYLGASVLQRRQL
jgi:hypothetical protein